MNKEENEVVRINTLVADAICKVNPDRDKDEVFLSLMRIYYGYPESSERTPN